MFKKMMASFGKGAATVNLHLASTQYQVGEHMQGEIVVKGGEVEQTINDISVHFFMETPDFQNHIETIGITSMFMIQAKEERIIPFSYTLPNNTPLSNRCVRFYFTTVLDIQSGVDNEDRDYIDIMPCTEVIHLFQALEHLGFQEKHDSGRIDEKGQEFSFEPFGAYRKSINEIEFYIHYYEDGIRLAIEVDIPTFYGEQEKRDTLFLPFDTLQDVSELTSYIDSWLHQRLGNASLTGEPHTHSTHHDESSGMGEMIAGVAAGVIGGMVLGEVLDEMFEEEEEEDE